jgi:two-component system chemotaxis response regulator CheB
MTVRVLVVDDSATMRGLITATLWADPGIEVVGGAADPHEARQAIKALHPDVVTLDIEMPNMNGLEFLERLMRLRPTPVIMVSALTEKGADIALQALETGAFDCVGKPSPGNANAFETLAEKVKRRCRAPPPAATHRMGGSSRSGLPPAGWRRCWKSCGNSRQIVRRR